MKYQLSSSIDNIQVDVEQYNVIFCLQTTHVDNVYVNKNVKNYYTLHLHMLQKEVYRHSLLKYVDIKLVWMK